MKTNKIEVVGFEEKPIEVLVASIETIANSMKRIEQTRLTRAAIVTLIKDASGVHKTTINQVLDNLESLEKNWLKPKPKRGVT